MESIEIINLISRTLMLILVLSLPPIIAATVIGLLVSLFQALTQIQEQTLGFVLKLVAVIVTLFAFGGWGGHTLYQFSIMIFDSLPTLAR